MSDVAEAEAPAVPVFSAPPRYKCLQETFIAPWLLKEGTVIDYDGEPGPHLEPMNEAAEAMMAAYYKAKPEASLNPTDALPITPGAAAKPSFSVAGQAQADEIISFVDMASNAAPGAQPARVVSLAEAQPGVRIG
jgi:hypothetical protein